MDYGQRAIGLRRPKLPVALCAVFFKLARRIGSDDAALDLVTRPSEVMELFFYLFIFGYLVVFSRRIIALEAHKLV